MKKEEETKADAADEQFSGEELNGFSSSLLSPDYGKLNIVIKTLEEKQSSDQRKFSEKVLKSNDSQKYVESDDLSIKCENCLVVFKDNILLSNHIERFHVEELNESIGLLDCPICGKLNLTDNQISIHQSIHTSGKHFECEYCLEGFNQKGKMDEHIQEEHTNDATEKYICRYFHIHITNF